MVDLYKKIEPRIILHSPVMADANALTAMLETWARFERTWRKPPEKKFAQVLAEEKAPK